MSQPRRMAFNAQRYLTACDELKLITDLWLDYVQ